MPTRSGRVTTVWATASVAADGDHGHGIIVPRAARYIPCDGAVVSNSPRQPRRKLVKEGLTEEEQAEVDESRDSHDAAMVEVQRALAELGYEATPRLKNLGTIAEKIEREQTRLTTIEDIAGAHLVIDGGRLEQDQAVEQIVSRWPDAKVRDRRAQPSHGDRAVHVIVDVEGRKVEIQVRGFRLSRGEIWDGVKTLADWIDAEERLDHALDRLEPFVHRMTTHQIEQVEASRREMEARRATGDLEEMLATAG